MMLMLIIVVRKLNKNYVPTTYRINLKTNSYYKFSKLGMWAMTFQYPWDFRKASWKSF